MRAQAACVRVLRGSDSLRQMSNTFALVTQTSFTTE